MLPVKRGRHYAFLIAVHRKRERTCVYAVMAASAEGALELVRALTPTTAMVELAGRLSRTMARSLKLKPGEPQPL